MSNTSVRFYKAVLCCVPLLLGGWLNQARAQTPPPIALSTDKQTYLQGEPVVLTMALTNVSDTLQQFGPIRVWGAKLQLTIRDAADQEMSLYPLWGGTLVSTWFEDEKSATLPGETEQGSVILTHYYDLTQPGTYTLEVSYAQTALEPTGKRNIFRRQTIGFETATTTITIGEPTSESDTMAAQLFASALQDLMSFGVDDTILQAFDQIIQDYPSTYLVEQAYFYRAFFNERTTDGSVGAYQQTVQAYQTFLQLYPTSRFVEFAVEGLNNARFLLDPPLSGQINFIDIFMLALCGDNLFRLANFNDQSVAVRYEVAETSESTDLVLPARSDTLLRTQTAGGLVRLFLDGELIQARFADPSSCGLLGQPVFPDLPSAVTVASDDASASFSGGSFTLSGFDHTLDGTPSGSGQDAHGVFATTAAAQQSLLDALANNQQNSVVGLDTPPDIAQGALDFDVATLIEALLALVTDTLASSPGGTLGTVDEPVVAYAPAGLTLTGNLSGTGMLIVDGPYSQRGSVQWTGLVIVRDGDGVASSFEMRGNAAITGGVLLYSEAGSVSVSLQGSVAVRYSRAAFEMLRTALFPTP